MAAQSHTLTNPDTGLSIKIEATGGSLVFSSEYTVGGLSGTVDVDYTIFETITPQ
jgi:hypothetical protein